MNPLEATWLVFGVSVHAYTVLLLVFTMLLAVFILGPNPKGLVGSAVAVALAVHGYEFLHGVFEMFFAGFLTPSVYLFNLPATVLCLLVLWRLNLIMPRIITEELTAVLLLSFVVLGLNGFYDGYPKTIMWALGKAVASLVVLSMLWRPQT